MPTGTTARHLSRLMDDLLSQNNQYYMCTTALDNKIKRVVAEFDLSNQIRMEKDILCVLDSLQQQIGQIKETIFNAMIFQQGALLDKSEGENADA